METSPRKTIEDFPKFFVTGLRRGPTAAEGYTHFEIDGYFDRPIAIEPTGPQWFWLLFGKRECLCAGVQSFNKETKAAALYFDAREEPQIVGSALAYLSPYWRAFNVWMVLDPDWGWEKKQFLGIDAIAEDYQAEETSIVEGREVQVWTKLSPARGGQSRLYPAANQTSTPASTAQLVPLGWDHEHCELCRAHIDVGMFGYRDPDDRWMCENCYAKYVVTRDLAFVDEL